MPILKKKTGRLCFAQLALLLAAASLAGCATQEDRPGDTVGRLVVSPGKYEFYNCVQLAQALGERAKRETVLEGLMVKAGSGAGGRLVSVISYEPEYVQVRGEINEIRKTSAAKNCKTAPAEEKPIAAAMPAVPPRPKAKR